MFDLTGKKALVTGSTQGIGLAIARCLGEHGATVYVNGATSFEKCIKAAKTVPNSQIAFQDLLDAECAQKLYDVTGNVDILVLNASIQYRKAWCEITSEEFDNQYKVNLKSNLEIIQKYAKYMMGQKWGRIITIGSVQQYKPHKDMLVYASTKAAQLSMVQNLSKQLAPYGITVNNIAPGVIETPRNNKALSNKKYEEMVLSGIPVGYAGKAEDCIGGALLFCSDEGRYITGVDLVIDGGMRL